MNKRFEELKRQASEYANRMVTFNKDADPTVFVGDVFNEKFAELIIKECVDICNTTKGSGYFNGEKAGRKIKEHFGIEE